MIKVLFLIHDLGQGGAEKVLVNLVNRMDPAKFDVSVTALFGGGVNEQFLAPHIHYRAVFPRMIPANSHIMKLFTPAQLHAFCVKEHYDIEVSYLEGPSARVISGCPHDDTTCVSWVHCTMASDKHAAMSFRNKEEAAACYNRMDRMVFVSQGVRDAFLTHLPYNGVPLVLYNTILTDEILEKAQEPAPEMEGDKSIALVAAGTLKEVKGFDRLLRIIKQLKEEQYPIHLYLLGIGPLRQQFEKYIADNELQDTVTLLGYQTNPYKYVAKSDLFVCSSHSEGFSTAATEALVVGTPVCTVEVSGMKEMLGENNEYGVVTENDEQALCDGIKRFLDDFTYMAHYKAQADKRGKDFATEKTVKAVEDMLISLYKERQA